MVPPEELEQYPRPRFRRFFLLPVAIAVAGAGLFAALQPADEAKQAPEFSLPLLGGGTLTSDELKGQPVVLNVWASWCAPCREEAPAFERLWRKHGSHGVQIIGVNIRDSDAGAQTFVDEFGITYPIVRDADQELAGELDLIGLPQTFFIDRSWNFLASESGEEVSSQGGTTVLGAVSEEDLEAQIQKLLDSPNP